MTVSEEEIRIPCAVLHYSASAFLISVLESRSSIKISIERGSVPDVPGVEAFIFIAWVVTFTICLVIYFLHDTVKNWPQIATKKDIATLPCRKWRHHEPQRAWGDISSTTISEGCHTQSHRDVLLECIICLENFKDGDLVMTLPCDHDFHKSCMYFSLTNCFLTF